MQTAPASKWKVHEDNESLSHKDSLPFEESHLGCAVINLVIKF